MTAEAVELEAVITALDTLWEEGEECLHPVTGKVVSNAQYDQMRKRLEEIHPTSELLKQVSASKVVSAAKKVTHNPPMTSISKAIGTLQERNDTLKKFQDAVVSELNYTDSPEKWAVQAYKRDGVAVALYYKKGKLVCAGLRPRKSLDGEDVTVQIQHVEGVPTELWEHDRSGTRTKLLDVTCCIRGELECKKSVFNKIVDDWENPIYDLNEKPKNPRNYTAGSIRQFSNPGITKERKLSFVGYSIVGWNAADNSPPPFKTEIERAKYSNSVLRVPFVQVRPYRYQDLQALEDLQSALDYEVDGVVISVNNLEDAEQMGQTGSSVTGNPKAKIAWKFSEPSAITTIRRKEWQVGRSGALTPVLQIDPVQLDGVTVSQVTGHSLGFVDGTSKSSLGELADGTEIRIIRSGKVIPKVVEIVKKSYLDFRRPDNCPYCKSKLVVEKGEDGSELVCTSDYCGIRMIGRLNHYLSTFGVKGVAESTLTKMYETRLVESFSELYGITVGQLTQKGFTERQALLIVARIWMCDDPSRLDDGELKKFIHDAYTRKVPIPAWQLFASLGIPGAGKAAGQALVDEFGSFDAIRKAKLEEIQAVPDVGGVTAKAIYDFFRQHEDEIDSLLDNVDPQSPKKGKFTGQTFVFTGGFPGGKEKWEKAVREHGAKTAASVSKKTNYAVIGTDAGSKEKKATELGITKLSLSDLEKML